MSIVFDSTTTGIFIRLLLAVGKRTSAILARVGPTGYLVSHDRNLAPRERASFLFASHCLDDISIYRLCQVKIPEPRQTAGRNVRRKMRRKMQDQTHQGCLRTRTDRNTDISPLEEGRERPHLGGFEKKKMPRASDTYAGLTEPWATHQRRRDGRAVTIFSLFVHGMLARL